MILAEARLVNIHKKSLLSFKNHLPKCKKSLMVFISKFIHF